MNVSMDFVLRIDVVIHSLIYLFDVQSGQHIFIHPWFGNVLINIASAAAVSVGSKPLRIAVFTIYLTENENQQQQPATDECSCSLCSALEYPIARM